MNINPLWSICLIVRISILILAGYLAKSKHDSIRISASIILLLIGLGFLYKYLTGSNDEIQISKVFWHETRLVHSALYILAFYYLLRKNSDIVMIILGLDVIFSVIYRISTDK